ncbi:MAG TPA: hypothetical protein PK264_06355 [Hyphomicrobiaceae bacterium]|nr:hypothetical protein [Hyphomicrobiaceae bacterium]
MVLRQLKRRAVAALAVSSALALTGCAAGDVELNGKIFDALGVSAATSKPSREPKLAARAPLVLPPSADRLPDPNAVPVAASGDPAWPVDADQKRVGTVADAARKHTEFCRDGNWKEKAMRDDIAAAKGPAGNCNDGSIFSAFKNLTTK